MPQKIAKLSDFGSCTLKQDGCTTCGDQGIPVQVIARLDETTALCRDLDGQEAEIAIDFAPEGLSKKFIVW